MAKKKSSSHRVLTKSGKMDRRRSRDPEARLGMYIADFVFGLLSSVISSLVKLFFSICFGVLKFIFNLLTLGKFKNKSEK